MNMSAHKSKVLLGFGLVFFALGLFMLHQTMTTQANNNNITADSGCAAGQCDMSWLRSAAGWHVMRESFEAENAATKERFAANGAPPKMCMLVRTYQKQLAHLPTFLLSSAASGLGVDNFRVFLLVTDPEWKETFHKVSDLASSISHLVGQPEFATVLPLPFKKESQPDFGYAQTDAALRHYFYNEHNTAPGQPHTCDYLIVTNGDNYYSHGFGVDLLKLTPNDLVMFDWVTHYPHVPSEIDERRVWGDGSGRPLEAQPRVSYIDLGACMWRLQFLKEHRLFYANRDGKWTNEADGFMVVKAVALTDAWRRLKKTILMHE